MLINSGSTLNIIDKTTYNQLHEATWLTLTFLPHICPKMDLGFEIWKTNVGIRIGILHIPYGPIFMYTRQL